MKSSPFSRSSLILLFSCALLLFALSVLLPAYDDSPRGDFRTRVSSYDASAIGHAAFYDMLRRLDFPVSRRLGGQSPAMGKGSLLVMIEPDGIFADDDSSELLAVPSRLVVLPKWKGVRDERRPDWISRAYPSDVREASLCCQQFADGTAEVVRTLWPATWKTNELGIVPKGGEVVQLVRSPRMRAVVGTDEGILVGETWDGMGSVWVLSDPDLLSNSGLVQGDNALFMVRLISTIRGEGPGRLGPPVMFDEGLHGFTLPENTSIRQLFRFPYSLVVLLVCLSGALLALAGSLRFGKPQRIGSACLYGTEELIVNGARMLDYAGYQDMILRRHARMTLRAAGDALHAPSGLGDGELAVWLDRIGQARGVELSCAELLRDIERTPSGGRRDLERLFALVGNMYQWKREILHDSGTCGQTR